MWNWKTPGETRWLRGSIGENLSRYVKKKGQLWRMPTNWVIQHFINQHFTHVNLCINDDWLFLHNILASFYLPLWDRKLKQADQLPSMTDQWYNQDQNATIPFCFYKTKLSRQLFGLSIFAKFEQSPSEPYPWGPHCTQWNHFWRSVCICLI